MARRQPANPLGWLLIAIAICMIAGTDGPDYALLRYHLGYHLPFGVAAVLLGQVWGLGIELLPLIVLLFPDGKLPSAWWRGALWAYVSVYALGIVSLGVATAVAAIAHPLQVDSNGGLGPRTRRPAGTRPSRACCSCWSCCSPWPSSPVRCSAGDGPRASAASS